MYVGHFGQGFLLFNNNNREIFCLVSVIFAILSYQFIALVKKEISET